MSSSLSRSSSPSKDRTSPWNQSRDLPAQMTLADPNDPSENVNLFPRDSAQSPRRIERFPETLNQRPLFHPHFRLIARSPCKLPPTFDHVLGDQTLPTARRSSPSASLPQFVCHLTPTNFLTNRSSIQIKSGRPHALSFSPLFLEYLVGLPKR
jgi:hypothetical protein